MKKEPRIKTMRMPVETMRSRYEVHKPETRSNQVRIRGRRLQEKRKEYWLRDPHCGKCKAFTMYPHGFEIDHIVRLADGGDESDENSMLLCISCHSEKTSKENA